MASVVQGVENHDKTLQKNNLQIKDRQKPTRNLFCTSYHVEEFVQKFQISKTVGSFFKFFVKKLKSHCIIDHVAFLSRHIGI